MGGAAAGALPWLLAAAAGAATLWIVRAPVGRIFRLAGRTLCSLAALAVVSPAVSLAGVSLGVNLWNALVLGLLGVPGFGLLLLLNWALA